jgi:hypothetical protein
MTSATIWGGPAGLLPATARGDAGAALCVALGTLAIGGCGSFSSKAEPSAGKPAVEKAGKLEIDANPEGQLAYTTNKATATPGRVTITMKNMSGVPHNIAIQQGSSGATQGPTREPVRHRRLGLGHRPPQARHLHVLLPGAGPPRGGDVGHADGEIVAATTDFEDHPAFASPSALQISFAKRDPLQRAATVTLECIRGKHGSASAAWTVASGESEHACARCSCSSRAPSSSSYSRWGKRTARRGFPSRHVRTCCLYVY